MDVTLSPRPATPRDYEHYLRFFGELGLSGDPIPDRARWEADWLPFTFFLERDGVPVGYGAARVLGPVGHLRHVVVDPGFRRSGVGRAIMNHHAERLRAAGCTRWILNVEADNARAIPLYEACGLTIAYRSVGLALAWAHLGALPRDEAKVRARLVEPGEDAALEAAFGMPRGRLTDRRTVEGNVLLRLVDPACPEDPRVGVACVDPAFPGAFPFHVARPGLAAPLLEAIRLYMGPDDVLVRLVIESDDALDAALRAVGATVKHVLLHMEGDIPAAGAGVAELEMDKDIAFENLALAKTLLDERGMRGWLHAGSLLGCYRGGALIDHDLDTDLAVHIEDWRREPARDLLLAMKAAGFSLKRYFGNVCLGLELCFMRRGVQTDLFFCYPEEDRVWIGGWLGSWWRRDRVGPKKCQLVKCYYDPFELSTLRIKGVDFYVPADTEKYLASLYGPGWRIPDPKWAGPWPNAVFTDLVIERDPTIIVEEEFLERALPSDPGAPRPMIEAVERARARKMVAREAARKKRAAEAAAEKKA